MIKKQVMEQEMKIRKFEGDEVNAIYSKLENNLPEILELVDVFCNQNPALQDQLPDILKAFNYLVAGFIKQGTLFVCGNGGSFADAIHIAGELMKSFERKRPLPEADRAKLHDLPFGLELAEALEAGFRVQPLGLNPSLTSALENDVAARYIMFAQELSVLGRTGDMLLGISTSGNAKNVSMAMTVARAKDMKTIALTGQGGGQLFQQSDLSIRVPATRTFLVQEYHIAVYHLLCAMVEAYWFKTRK